MPESFCVLDFETTGLNPEVDKIIEVAAMKVVGGEIVTTFNTIVNNGPVIPKITELTGITNEQIALGMEDELAFRMIRELIRDTVIIAHNAVFDLAFLHYGFVNHFDETFDNEFYDTLTIARDRNFYPHTLTEMCKRYGIDLTGAHRALADVEGCYKLFTSMDARKPVAPWKNKLGFVDRHGPAAWYPANAIVFPIEIKYKPKEG